jgi:hypothetical protein
MITTLLILSTLFNLYFIGTKLYENYKTRIMEKQEEITLTFLKGRDGKTIARTESGKICLLDIPYCKAQNVYINESETWRCAVKEERENCVIVQPIQRTATAAENEAVIANKVDGLRDKFIVKKKGSPDHAQTS